MLEGGAERWSQCGCAVPVAAWSKACATLRCELGEDTFGSWIAPAHLRSGASAGEVVVVTPTGLARDWIKRNAWRRHRRALECQLDPEHRRLALKSRTEFEGGATVLPMVAEPRRRRTWRLDAPDPIFAKQ